MNPPITRKSLFYIWVENSKILRFETILAFILQELNNSSFSETALKSIKATIRSFCQKIEKRWDKVARHKERFLNDYSSWLQGDITFPAVVFLAFPSTSTQYGAINRPGRPKNIFSSCGPKARSLKVKKLLVSTSHDELLMATEMKLRNEGKRDSAAIVKELCFASPKRGTAIKKGRKFLYQKLALLSADQGLALIVDANLSTRQFNLIRQQAKGLYCRLYPPYYKVKEAKQLCYPPGISITETTAEIPLQSLIDHTVSRLCNVKQIMESLCLPENSTLNIIIKWGCDGADQNRYRQKISEEYFTDESLFSISMVPIQIYSGTEESNKTKLWQNPAPSSTRLCRPIKFIFAKESVDVISTEVRKIGRQIATILSFKIFVKGTHVTVKSTLIFCMIDGKVCNAVTSCASTQTCYLCGAKPSTSTEVLNVLKTSSEINPALIERNDVSDETSGDLLEEYTDSSESE